jgi:hypothetical protein
MPRQLLTETLQTLGVVNPVLTPLERYTTGPSFFLPCAGVYALALWYALRQVVAQTGYWPLILGDAAALAEHRDRLSTAHAWSGTSDISITHDLQTVQTTDAPAWFQAHYQRVGHPTLVVPPLGAQPPSTISLPSERPLRLATHPYDPEANTMTIPTTVITLPVDHPDGPLSLTPTPVVFLGLFPAPAAWHLPLYLQYGGWNESPACHTHAMVWRWWETWYGAELVGIAHTCIEGWVGTPPQTPTGMARLAWEMDCYCPDSGEQNAAVPFRTPRWVWRFAWH